MKILDRLLGRRSQQKKPLQATNVQPSKGRKPMDYSQVRELVKCKNVDGLIAALSDKDKNVRKYAADGLRELGDKRAVDSLIAALRDKNMDVRRAVADALGELRNKKAVDSLITVLNDTTDYPVFKEPLQIPSMPIDARVEAAIALGKIGGEAAIAALKAVVDTSIKRGDYRGLSLSEAVEKALAELGASDREEEQVSGESTQSSERSSEAMVKTADELRIQGQLEEALKLAKQASDKDPSNGYAWMEMGMIEVARCDVLSATRAFMNAVKVNPDLKGSEPGARLAVVYDSLGMEKDLEDVCSSLRSSGLGLEPSAEREWEQLVASVDHKRLRATVTADTYKME